MCSRKWNVSYTTLLSLFGIPSLSVRHSHSKLLFLFKILNHLIYFPPHIFTLKPPPHYPIRSYDFLTLIIPFSNTHAHANSFVLSIPPLFGTLCLFTSNLPHLFILLEPNYLILATMTVISSKFKPLNYHLFQYHNFYYIV